MALRIRNTSFARLCNVLFSCWWLISQSIVGAAAAPASQTFNLGSTAHSQVAGAGGTISVAGHALAVHAGDAITPAESAALLQVINNGHQTLRLGSLGNAIGGTLSLRNDVASNSNLVIPHGVSALVNLTGGDDWSISGDLTNSGRVFAYGVGTVHGAGTLSAFDIYNNPGALISSMMPKGSFGIQGIAPIFDFGLSALGDIINSGTISSSGSLSLRAGGQIENNAVTTTGRALILARNDISLSSAAGMITNAGLIKSLRGNINVANDTPDVLFNNAGGLVEALRGNIDFHDSSFTGSGNLTLTGGDWLSRQMNLYAGNGDVEVNVGSISGELNTQAGVEHVLTSTRVLSLGSSSVNGDPTFANAGGSIVINGTLTETEDLVILAAGNITAGSSGSIVDHGNNVTLVAGAKITLSGGGGNSGTINVPASGQVTGADTATIDLSTGNGGDINLSGSNAAVVIDTSANAADTNGGNVTLAAFANGTKGGTINVPGEIRTSSSGFATGGNVTIIAGGNPASPGNTITLGTINTGADGTAPDPGSPGTGGNILIVTAQPTSAQSPDSPQITYDSTGQSSGGDTITYVTTLQSSVGPDGNLIPAVRPNAKINITGDLNASPRAGGTGGTAANAGDFAGGAGVDGAAPGNITIYAGNSITAKNILAYGGGGGGGGGGAGGDGQGNEAGCGGNGGSGGAGGTIIVSSALGDINATSVNASGGGGGGTGGGGGAEPGGVGASGSSAAPGVGGAAGSITLQAGGVMVIGQVFSKGGSAGGTGGCGGAGACAPGGGGGGGGGGGSLGGTVAQGGGGGGGGSGQSGLNTAFSGGAGGAGGSAGAAGGGSSPAQGGAAGSTTGVGGNGGTFGSGATDGKAATAGSVGASTSDDTSNDMQPIIEFYGGTPDQVYLSDANYQDRETDFSTFAQNITPRSTAGLFTGSAVPSASITGVQTLFVQEDGAMAPMTTNATPIVPAEAVAITEVGYTGHTSNAGGQTLILGAGPVVGATSANAIGGSFTTTAANDPGLPANGNTPLQGYTLPAGVTNNITESTLTTTGDATVSGTVSFAGSGTFVADSFTVNAGGKMQSGGSSLTLQITPAVHGTVNNSGTISNTTTVSILGAAGQDLDVQGTGRFSARTTNITSSGELLFDDNAPTVLTFTGTANLTAASELFLGDPGLVSLTAPHFNLLGHPVEGDVSNLHGASSISVSGTLANPNGNLTIPTNLIASGDLAILAAGDILAAKGVSKITTASKLGDAGTVTMVAGFDFTAEDGDASSTTPAPGTYDNFAANSKGGSIYLPKVSIDTSSKAATGSGGNVTIVANAGTNSAGTIFLKTITTSGGASADAGNVVIIGGGGISTGAITAKGGTGGSVNLFGSQPTPSTVTPPSISAGALSGSFGAFAASANNGAAIVVNGAVTTSASQLTAGAVRIEADSQVIVTKGIIATGVSDFGGATAGGAVLVTSLSLISIGGSGINSSANTVNSNASTGGTGGAITLGSATFGRPDLVIAGSLVSRGGSNSGAGGGGIGGTVSISTALDSSSNSIGTVELNGFIDSRGGSSIAKVAGAGGSGGSISVTAGTLAVKGNISGASINASGGLGSKGGAQGAGQSIAIDTFAVQAVPSAFDLTSTKASIPLMAGGMFSIAAGAPVNGVSGKIVSDANVLGTKQFVFGTSAATSGNVTVTVHGLSQQPTSEINESGSATTFAPDFANVTTGVRTMITPAQAVAFYQVSHGLTQLFVPATSGAASSGSATFTQTDVNALTFSAFKMPAGLAISITVSGARPTLNIAGGLSLPSGSTLNINGTTDGFLNLNSGALSVAATATLQNGAGSLIIAGTGGSWNNSGTISASSDVAFARSTTRALTFSLGQGGLLSAAQVVLDPSIDVGMSFKFASTAASPSQTTLPIDFTPVPLPTLYLANSTAIAANATVARKATLGFALQNSGGAAVLPEISGSLSAASIAINGTSSTVKGQSPVVTSITVQDGTTLAASKSLSISATGTLTIASTNGVSLSAGLLNQNGSSATSWNGTLLQKTDISQAGTFSLTSTGPGGIAIGNATGSTPNFLEVGGTMSIKSTVGGVAIGNGNIFRDMGGNIVILSQGAVSGGTTNALQAKGVINTATGGIEIDSATQKSTISTAFKHAPTPGATINGGTILGTTYVLLTPGVGTINLGMTSPATLDFTNKGVMQFNALGSGGSIVFQNGTFTTVSSKPVSSVEILDVDDFIVDTDEDVPSGRHF